MSPLTTRLAARLTPARLIPFIVGGLLLLGAWYYVAFVEGLFAESHLASYYCCLTPQEAAGIGPVERALSEFFTVPPGQYLPGLLFILGNLALLAHALRRSATIAWLPLIFAVGNLVYVLAAVLSFGLSWSISDWIVGPRATAYKGYDRTWYGIVLHLALWVTFFSVMLKATRASTTTSIAGVH